MSYCINPQCSNRQNSDKLDVCQACGTPLLIQKRYRIVRPLKEPKSGHPTDIFEVEDWGAGLEDWGSLKVLKVLKYNNNPDLVRLLKQEARVLMWLRHPGIPRVEPDDYFTVYPSKTNQLLHCLVMEKIEGQNLELWLNENQKLSQDEALDWLQQILEILDQLHSQNLLHRDLKPSNLILRPNGQLAVIDFGTVGIGDWGSTQVGSMGYSAPEQMSGKAVLQSDFFALGRTFIHLLTGQSPMNFPTEEKTGKIQWKNQANQISDVFADLINELMQPSPKNRPKNTRLLLQRLEKVREKITQEHKNISKTALSQLKFLGWFLLGTISVRFISPQIPIFIQTYILPQIDKTLTNIGFEHYQNYNLERAEFYYQLALQFNPDNAASALQLGLICEDKQNFGCARSQYQAAIQSAKQSQNYYVKVAAINNLSRLQIWLDGNSTIAIEQLQQGLQLIPTLKQQYPEPFTFKMESDLYKNLGWAYAQQTEYSDALVYLQTAIEINSENAPAHCLLAQVLEEIPQKKLTLQKVRKNCLNIDSIQNPETITWKSLVRQRLKAEGEI
ncbi:protein kinase domain-containing protein [Capilliphycus salinus ALCB114379]|uniref:protein kinase domain-containing protein n=1 Tax=Capilliphycus salinus TaxID=2768948 RepID=UPI0039A6C283